MAVHDIPVDVLDVELLKDETVVLELIDEMIEELVVVLGAEPLEELVELGAGPLDELAELVMEVLDEVSIELVVDIVEELVLGVVEDELVADAVVGKLVVGVVDVIDDVVDVLGVVVEAVVLAE